MWWLKLLQSVSKVDSSSPITMSNIQDFLDLLQQVIGG